MVDECVCALFLRVVGDVGVDFVNLVLYLLHALLEALDAFAQAAHQLGNLLRAKQEQHNQHDDNQFWHSNAAKE